MTTAEAIKQLQTEHDLIATKRDLDGSQFAPELLEALAMAIEALKAQNMILYMNLPEVSAEEAVEILKRNNRIELIPSGKDTNVPSKDCIDRAEAQTAIQFAARRYTVAHEAHGEGHVVWSDNLISVTDAMNALRGVPPAQPERIQNNAVHLCDSCQYTYVTCPSHGNDAVFGDGKGNDNICACNKYRPISAQPERTCVNCGRTANNGGWYADGGTRCPIEEHYALPKDGFCHLWEKRNVTDDDYPERREE